MADLEAAGIGVIQIDEPALREGLPLAAAQWAEYLRWAVDAFRLSSAGVRDETQIHTHMCYCEFNDIIESIAALDADVISIEASRSDMELLDAFARFNYPNEIGPGVYDIHSPRVPEVEEIMGRLQKALGRFRPDQLWVNPDCGLKTRGWPRGAGRRCGNMVEAAEEPAADDGEMKPCGAGVSPAGRSIFGCRVGCGIAIFGRNCCLSCEGFLFHYVSIGLVTTPKPVGDGANHVQESDAEVGKVLSEES